jgi:hypothetical protein
VFGKLLLSDDMGSARSTTLPAATRPPPGGAGVGAGGTLTAAGRGGTPALGRRAGSAGGGPGAPPAGRAPGALRTVSAGRARAGSAGAFDTPRGLGEEGASEEQELAVELDSVKRERERLLDAIAHVRTSAGGRVAAEAPPRVGKGAAAGRGGGEGAGLRVCRACTSA